MAKIFLVDDEKDITIVLRKGLEAAGFAVDDYNDPAEALVNHRSNYYDFHILDIRMPGTNGFQLARAIWQHDPNAQICFLSSFEIFEDEARKVFKNLSTPCFVKKPITPRALAEHLRGHSIATQ